jgi:anaerobic magnesium-protoporphyrin IX monomethyl ester cyclase
VIARERFGAAGIRVGYFIQLGYLGEQLEDLQATRALIARAAPDDIGVSVSYPLPGTQFYEQVKAQLGNKTHWQDSGDLAMMFQGAYDSEFYRHVRDLLHEQVVVQQWEVIDQVDRRPQASRALDARWRALIDSEAAHRTTPMAAPLLAGSSRHV